MTHRDGVSSDRAPRTVLFGILLLAMELFGSCAPLFRPDTGISDIRVEHKKNGCLVTLQGNEPVKNVAAFISTNDWLIITLVGTTVDFDRLRSWRTDDPIGDVAVVGYKSSVQVTLKLTAKFRSCEVVPGNDSDNVEIALFNY